MAPVLVYWNLRGICQPIRFLLAHAGVDYEEKNFFVKEDGPPEEACSNWYDVKYTFGLEFPNLPQYIDGSFQTTQTGAILRYLAEKHDLAPTTPEEKRRVNLVEYQIVDCRHGLIETVFNFDGRYEKLKEKHEKATVQFLKQFSDFLGNHKWLGGDKVTYVDFMFYEYLYQHNIFLPGCVDKHSNLREYMDRFETLPNIAKYIKTQGYRELATFGPHSKFDDPARR